jgi:hypothetical protein
MADGGFLDASGDIVTGRGPTAADCVVYRAFMRVRTIERSP